MKKLYNKIYSNLLELFFDDPVAAKEAKEDTRLIQTLFKFLAAAAVFASLLLFINLIFGLGLADIFKEPLSELLGKTSVDAIITIGESLGTFGDFFGGVLNPVLTFLTFFGLMLTIVFQRIELRQSRIEANRAATALVLQSVEATFFNLIALHHKIIDGLLFDAKIIPNPRNYADRRQEYEKLLRSAGVTVAHEKQTFETKRGRDVFGAVLDRLTFYTEQPEAVLARYKNLQDNHNYVLGHYFRNLYQALKLIDKYPDNTLSKEEKEKYASILRAQLSSNELIVLFYNCLEGVVDSGQFKRLLIEYKMLEHIPLERKDGLYKERGSGAIIASESFISQYIMRDEHGIVTKNAFGTNQAFCVDQLNAQGSEEIFRPS